MYPSRQKEHPYLGELSITIIIKPRRSILNGHQKNLHTKQTVNPYHTSTLQITRNLKLKEQNHSEHMQQTDNDYSLPSWEDTWRKARDHEPTPTQ